MKAQSELTGDRESAAEMTAPNAYALVTAWTELKKIAESTLASIPKINIEPICSGITALTDSFSTLVEPMEVVFASPDSNARAKTP